MKILFNPSEIKESYVLAVGNFDGVHMGHRYLLAKAREIATQKNLKLAVMTFEPHPLHLFRRDLIPARITSIKTKLELLAEIGVEVCFIMKFNRKFSEIKAVDFVENFLASSHVVTGYDFSFGHMRGGNSELLKEMLGNNYTAVAAKGESGLIYSSSSIRGFLREGNIQAANKMLGYEYMIEGKVVNGDAAGLGFPTANLRLKPYVLRPVYGVYVVETNYGYGVANFGIRPTVDGTREFLEVHIFDFDKNIYGEALTVKFLDFIREERKFTNIEELKKQITEDIKNAKEKTKQYAEKIFDDKRASVAG